MANTGSAARTGTAAIQRDYDPAGLTVAEREARGQRTPTVAGVP